MPNVEGNVIDMIQLRCEIEKELSEVTKRVGFGYDKP